MTNLLLKLFIKDYKNTKDENVRKKYGLLGSFFGLITNFVLFLAKIVIGILLGLFSIIADSINNLSDFGNNALSIFGFKVSSKRPDKEHPYGHQRLEYIISLLIACIIIALGCIMLYQAINDLVIFINTMVETSHPPLSTLSYVEYVTSLSIMAFAIFIKALQSRLYYSLGKKIDSLQLKALGRDALNDVISTSTVIISIIITYFTGYEVDCFFTLVVGVLVVISGISILKASANILIGEKPDGEIVKNLIKLCLKHKEVLGLHDLTIHNYGRNVFAVLHLELDAKKDIMESHSLVDTIERECYDQLHIHLTIHMDPILIDDPDTNYYKNEVVLALRQFDFAVQMHDFRILSAKDYVNLIFDLVIPDEYNNEEGHKMIIEKLHNNMRQTPKSVHFAINFDDSLTDFLSEYQEEK